MAGLPCHRWARTTRWPATESRVMIPDLRLLISPPEPGRHDPGEPNCMEHSSIEIYPGPNHCTLRQPWWSPLARQVPREQPGLIAPP